MADDDDDSGDEEEYASYVPQRKAPTKAPPIGKRVKLLYEFSIVQTTRATKTGTNMQIGSDKRTEIFNQRLEVDPRELVDMQWRMGEMMEHEIVKSRNFSGLSSSETLPIIVSGILRNVDGVDLRVEWILRVNRLE